MIVFNSPTAIQAISASCRVPFILNNHQCIARYDARGELMGGVFFTDYNVKSMCIHVASFKPNWINRELLWLTFDTPFNKWNIEKLIGTVPSTNTDAITFNYNLGFRREAIIKDVFADGDMLIMGMYKSDCRFLNMRPPKQFTFRSNNRG